MEVRFSDPIQRSAGLNIQMYSETVEGEKPPKEEVSLGCSRHPTVPWWTQWTTVAMVLSLGCSPRADLPLGGGDLWSPNMQGLVGNGEWRWASSQWWPALQGGENTLPRRVQPR